MTISPLRLESYLFPLLHVAANEFYERKPSTFSFTVTAGTVAHPDGIERIVVNLALKSITDAEQKLPMYSIHVIASGVFFAHSGASENLVAQQGALALLGPIREMVALLTARGPHGVIFVPMMTFAELEKAEVQPNSDISDS